MIKDSGTRKEFTTGAVRDMQEGKGRFDLMPLEVVADLMNDRIMRSIASFMDGHDTRYLFDALKDFSMKQCACLPTAMLEVAVHFEEGARKYGENNWRNGIPPENYIDSAVRHYMKWLRGDSDERHDRAFLWNLLCCIWEVERHE